LYFKETGKAFIKYKTVPITDTGKQVEYTQASKRTILKELGKLALYFGKRGAKLNAIKALTMVTEKREQRLFNKNTGPC